MTFKEFSFVAYATKDVKQSRAFYEGVLGLKASSIWEDDKTAFIEYPVGPDTLVIGMGSDNFKPGKTGATVTLEVEDMDTTIKELKEKKAKFLMEEYNGPVCRMVLLEDPDGNQIAIHRRKEK